MPRIRAYADNVILKFLPEPRPKDAILFMPETRKPEKVRRAEVIASGPGYYRDNGFGHFVPNEVKEGDVVLVDRQAGQDYYMDVSVPRQNKAADWGDKHGEFRAVRHDEILAVLVEEEQAAAE